jgi:hypothetical protein
MPNQPNLFSRTVARVLNTRSGAASFIQQRFYRLAFNLARRIALVQQPSLPPFGSQVPKRSAGQDGREGST